MAQPNSSFNRSANRVDFMRETDRNLAGGGELVVADGNHRSLSAQQAGLDRFLAVDASEEKALAEIGP